MLKSIQELLEFSFEVLNKTYFNGELPPIVISIMSSPRTNGHFTLGKVWRANEDRYNEINVSAEHLERPIENIIATLLHEMVHYYCHLNNIPDVSQGGRYHNKNFKREAEKRGLIISYEKYIGYSVTEPSQELIEVIQQNGIVKPLDINRDGERYIPTGLTGGGEDGKQTPPTTAPPKKKTSTRKYICPSCGNSFRCTKDINVGCLDCGQVFIKVEK